MTPVKFFLESLVLLLSLVYFWFLIENEINRYRKGNIIYYASNLRIVVPLIASLLPAYYNEDDKCSLVELGAGQALAARGLSRVRRWKTVVAIEWAPSLVALARIRSGRQVQIVRTDMYGFKPERPSVVYCYLAPGIMKKLYESGNLNGCLVFSLTFEIPVIEADRICEFRHWQSPLRVYDLRHR